ncbi:MAG: DEAD/DEAH box helicase [Candidatus Krumholzibacteria bacterium]|nr:DEAD/DEAH box helicase [Candidatus Krumholzibacteria bacterium]
MIQAKSSFFGLGIAPGLLGVLDALKFTVPTPIQEAAIPIAIAGKDVIGVAQTGTGKTIAYGIPMIQRLAQGKSRGLVLVPTRELALQVHEDLSRFARAFKLRTAVVIGGESIGHQIRQLKEHPHIIIATPGRLNDHLEQRQVRLSDVGILVLDEADRMLDMGFLPQIERIIKLIPRARQTMLFSATMHSSVLRIASNYMHLPVRTEIAPSGTATDLVTQEILFVQKDHKARLLGQVLAQYAGSVLLFVRTKRGAGKVARLLREMGHSAAEIHADRSQPQRKEALRRFKTGECRILVATDIAARGIDVKDIELVINYDLPDEIGNYVHRIGRTGRAGKRGHAIAFATPDQRSDVREIERFMCAAIPVSGDSEIPAEELAREQKAAAKKPAFGRTPRPAPRRLRIR